MTTASSRAVRGEDPPRGMAESIGSFLVRRARLVLVVAVLAVVAFGVLGVGAFAKLQSGGFQDPGADSTTAQTLTDHHFGGADSVVLLVHADAGTVDGAAARAAGTAAAGRLAAVPGVSNVTSYWHAHDPGLRSKDGKYALILGSTRSDHDLKAAQLASLPSRGGQVEVTVGGDAAVSNDILHQVATSLRTAETIAVPVILALLVFAFGSVVAALLPLAIGGIAILGTFAELFVLGSVTSVAIYAINLTTALGLALAIDYALLMVSRFREELAVALPLVHIQLGTPDDRVLPSTTQSRSVGDVLRADFPGDSTTALNVVTDGPLDRAALTTYATRLSDLAGVARVDASVATYTRGRAVLDSADPALERPAAQRLSVVSTADPRSTASQDLVRTVRDLPAPDGVRVYVGGQTAELIDTTHAIGSRLPLAALLVALTTFIVLFLFTGSVVQPLRSILLNGVTLAATAGLMVWIFQQGHMSGLLHFTPLPLDTSMLMLLFCIAFGLSMDYEVIVLSRIKELHDQGRDNRTTVIDGLTAWYAPAPLRRLQTRIGLTEASG